MQIVLAWNDNRSGSKSRNQKAQALRRESNSAKMAKTVKFNKQLAG
jgi:hypothetical protein